MRPRGVDLTAAFFHHLRRHLSEGVGVTQCARALQTTPQTFDAYLREAYHQGYLTLRPKVNDDISRLLTIFLDEKFASRVKVVVADGDPDSQMFASLAAENLLLELRSLLEDGTKKTVTLLIISGSTTGELVHECVIGSLWDEIIRPPKIDPPNKVIRLLAGNITPIYGEELYGNALASVVLLSRFVVSKLPPTCQVVPYGLVAPIVVNRAERRNLDTTINREILKIVDPGRLGAHEEVKDRPIQTQVDMIISGIGSFDWTKQERDKSTSVFQWVINEEGLEVSKDLVGDAGFYGIDREGHPVPLFRPALTGKKKESEEVFIYSVSSPNLMRSLVRSGGKVLLVARSRRLFGKVPVQKTDALIASLKGRLGNIFVTDLVTAQNILLTDGNHTLGIINSLSSSAFDPKNLVFLGKPS